MHNKKSIMVLIVSIGFLFSPVVAQEAEPQINEPRFILHQQCINSNGQTMENGEEATFFKSGTDGCEQQKRTCTAGILGGDSQYQHTQCISQTETENNCTRNNQKIAEFSTIIAYKDAVVSRDKTCSFVQRVCIGGELQGPADFSQPSCQFENRYSDEHKESHPDDYDKFGNIRPEVLLLPPINTGEPCTTAWGETIPSGETVVSFGQQYGGLQGIREYKVNLCLDGLFDGETGKHASSIHINPDQIEAEKNAAVREQLDACIQNRNGMVGLINEYQEKLAACDPEFVPEYVTTLDGFSGLDDEPCLRDGQEIKHGETVTAYQKGTFKNGVYVCPEETRTCTNGELSGTYKETKCRNPGGNGPHRCATPIGPLEHGKSITLYEDSIVQYPNECTSIERVCEFGNLQGDDRFDQSSCKQVGDFCTTPNGTVSHGSLAITYTKETVPFGVDCDDYKREIICTNGSLEGKFNYSSCYAQDPKPCVTPDNMSVQHGQIVTRYQEQQVIGQPSDGQDECNRQARTCNDGKRLDSAGNSSPFTYQYTFCNVVPPAGSNISN